MSTDVLLLHGAATGPSMYKQVVERLSHRDVLVAERPRSGSLDQEFSWLAPLAQARWVVGVSGGATLALAAALGQVNCQPAGVIAHEPAVGSLSPNLLAPMKEAFAKGGTASFARVLYGALWEPAMYGPDDVVTSRELAMFGQFEPALNDPICPLHVSHGTLSAPLRGCVSTLLAERYGCSVHELAGVGHFAPVEDPGGFAAFLERILTAHDGADA